MEVARQVEAKREISTGGTETTTTTTPRMFSEQAQVDTAKEKHKAPRQFHRKSLGDWDFLETVGAGSMGKVKLAKNRKSHEVCAIKIVHRATKAYLHKEQQLPPPADESELKERQKKLEKEMSRDRRTVRESSLGQVLSHPNVCKLYEMQTLSNHYCMFFEYISGGQLLDYIIQHGSLKESHARRFARGILSALQYLHANNIVHRDLKIENIMISKTGEIKLIDFGLSNMYDPRKSLQTFCGSLYFAAPELLKANPYLGPEVDVWSFGVVLYVLVCGKVPFDDENSSALHEKIKKGKVTYPQFLSIDVISLLSKILVVDPHKRASLQQVVNHQWVLKGYDFPPQSYIPKRTPITPDQIDVEVLREMYRLEFIEDIDSAFRKLVELVSEPEYKHLSEEFWEEVKTSHDSFDISQYEGDELRDPTQGYHPLISLYHLTSEKLKKDSNVSSNSWLGISNISASPLNNGVDREYVITQKEAQAKIENREPSPTEVATPVTSQTSTMAQQEKPKIVISTNDNIDNGVAKPTVKKIGHIESIPSPKSATDGEKSGFSNIFRRFSQRHSKPINSLSPASRKTERTHTRAVSDYMSAVPQNVKHELQKPVEIIGSNLPALPANAELMIETNRNKDGENEVLPPVPHIKGKKLHPTARAKSVGHARRESLNYTRPAVPPNMAGIEEVVDTGFLQTPDVDRSADSGAFKISRSNPVIEDLSEEAILEQASKAPPGSMPSIDFPRTLFLKGFFSVQTTSSKPLPIVRYKIISVLKKHNIEYVEVKGGFVCSKTPTVGLLSSKTAPEKVETINNDTEEMTLDWSSQQSPKSLNDGRMITSDLEGENGEPHLTEGHSTSSLNAYDHTDMLHTSKGDYLDNFNNTRTSISDRSPIKFEIHIVKVRIVGLAGIHFKKLSGNTWMYKELATQILSELKL